MHNGLTNSTQAEFLRHGVSDVVGYDGGAVEGAQFKIPRTCFERIDLESPPPPQRRFDVALCLEVAEHLSDSAANDLIAFLTSLSDIVLFSAAIPHQGGTNHVNEQPLSYWIGKFDRHAYEVLDVVRPEIWDDLRVAFWYRQNMVLAVRRSVSTQLHTSGISKPLDIVHPELLALWVKRKTRPKKTLGYRIMRAFQKALA